jgi:hypothetical protein
MNFEGWGNTVAYKTTTIFYIGTTVYKETVFYVTPFYWSCVFISLFLQIALFCCHHLARKVNIKYHLE